jgi:4-aminobutyrate aminotransferase-like enzyme
VKRAELARLLQTYESRNVAYVDERFPIFWESAERATVTDVEGKHYIDCTAAFGVANVGHCNPHVVSAIAAQAQRLMHAMGDVHPPAIRARLLERLVEIVPHGLGKVFLATTGSEAIEAALKTAILATGKSRFAAYRGAYHGLSFGALLTSGIERFRQPFADTLAGEPVLLEYPRAGRVTAEDAIERVRDVLGERRDLAAVVMEPIQGRAGCIVPPREYLSRLRALCDELQILLIVDEIYTGFGRTGSWFAVDHENMVPDILCIGKAMGSGFPISATIGRATIMDAWPQSTGEALHTSTFLGNPLGCAAALATIEELTSRDLVQRAARLGVELERGLNDLRELPGVLEIRGRGMMWGIQLPDTRTANAVMLRALADGVIVLQSGADGATVSLTPPLVIEESQVASALETLRDAIVSTAR